MPALAGNALEKDDGIAGEIRHILRFAMNDESELEPMLETVTRLLQKGLAHQVDQGEAMEVALAVVDAVSTWLKHRNNPMWGGGGPRIANAMRERVQRLVTGRESRRPASVARSQTLVNTRSRWATDPQLRADFGDNANVYEAFLRADAEGRVRIHGRQAQTK